MAEDREFLAQYESLVTQANEDAHQIALRVLQEEDSRIEAGLRLDYSHSMSVLMKFLADHRYTEPGHTFVNTVTQGPVAVEDCHEQAEDGGSIFRVYRFDRVELDPEDVSPEDLDAVYDGYRRLVP